MTLPTHATPAMLRAALDQAQARIAELEAQVAALQAKPAKRVATRKPQGDPCQYCGDGRTDKRLFLGLPMCVEWKPCAARMRQAKGIPGYAWDRRYSVKRANADSPWVARFGDTVLGLSADRGEARRIAYDHRNAAAMRAAA